MSIDEDTIAELALAPKRTRTEEGTVEEHNPEHVIKADLHTRTVAASNAVPWGMRFARQKCGSTTPGGGGT